jgi:hypothetical protein
MKPINIPPIALSATMTTNLLNCNVTSLAGPVGMTMTQAFLLITHIRFVNKDGSNHAFSLWKGATGANTAGTEVIGQAKIVVANDSYDWYGEMRMDAADFLVGGADSASKITMQIEAEIGHT